MSDTENPPQPNLESSPQNAESSAPEKIQDSELAGLRNEISLLRQELGGMQRQLEIVQGSVRQVALRITDAASSLSAPRMRELYLRLLCFYDLLEPPGATLSEKEASLCGVLKTQIEQLLEVNGVMLIQGVGLPFDPQVHKQVEVLPDDGAGSSGLIASIRRNGFRTEMAILRLAEVVVIRCNQPESRSVGNSEIADETKQIPIEADKGVKAPH